MREVDVSDPGTNMPAETIRTQAERALLRQIDWDKLNGRSEDWTDRQRRSLPLSKLIASGAVLKFDKTRKVNVQHDHKSLCLVGYDLVHKAKTKGWINPNFPANFEYLCSEGSNLLNERGAQGIGYDYDKEAGLGTLCQQQELILTAQL